MQIARTVAPGRYRNPHPAPGAAPFPIAAGESSVFEQYLAAIASARRTIYLENQFFASLDVLAALTDALRSGVAVVAVVPGVPIPEVRAARGDPRSRRFFEGLAALGEHERFTLAALAVSEAGRVQDV